MDLKFPEPLEFLTKTSGINNRSDASSLATDELAECIDFVVDDLGLLETRVGLTKILEGDFHSAPQEPDIPYIVENRVTDSALYFVNPDITLKGVRNLISSNKVSFTVYSDRVYYSNGVENGFLVHDISYAWPNPVAQTDDHRIISPAPVGSHIASFMGRMLIAVGPVMYVSEYLDPHSYELHRNFYDFGSDIKMIRPTEGGVYVSNSDSVFFLSGEIPGKANFKKVSTKPAIEWSDIAELIQSEDLGINSAELSAIWVSIEGVFVGTSTGTVVPINKHKITYPASANIGAGVLLGRTFIHSF